MKCSIGLAAAILAAAAPQEEGGRITPQAENLTTQMAAGASRLPPILRDLILKVEEMRSDISLLHLLCGLNLTREQAESLLARGREAKALRDTTFKSLEPMLRDAEASFAALKRELEGGAVRDATLEAAERANVAQKELKERFDRKMTEIEDRTRAIFTEAQQEVIRKFRPCVVPTKEDRNPERVGQAPEAGGFIRVLEHLRNVPADRLEEAKRRGLEMHFLRWERHFGVLTAKEKEEIRRQLDAVLAESRSLPDADFEIRKSELAQAVEMPASHKTRPRLYEPGKIGRLLLDERAIPILERRLSRPPPAPPGPMAEPREPAPQPNCQTPK